MQTRYRNLFTTIRTEGAILPPDLLQRISSGDSDLEGLTPESYHLSGERLNEATNRSWSRIGGAWNAFKTARDRLPANDLGTSVTRERWLLTLFQELGYGRLLTARSIEIDGKGYPISHGWQNTPIHLMGFRVDLDKRTTGVAGAARSSPHSLVQELLNRSDEHLWAFVSNGLRLRILRDNVSLTRQAYVEFDLEAMMDGEVYADFVLLWLLCHESRIESEKPESCWLEKWSRTAQEQGTRALDQLRNGVEEAINALGSGFLTHSANDALREKLQSGELDKQDYYRQLLRFVYRLLFLFVAEDWNLLLDPNADDTAKERYTRFYSTIRVRQLAERRRGTRHGDLVYGLWLVMGKLGSVDGCPELGLPALGSFLFDQEAMSELTGLDIANSDLLDAVRALAFITDGNKRRPVDYKNLRSEELGSVYESLLELHPEMNVDAGAFELKTAGGNERKTTGSYYTPDSLVQCLLDSALDPVLDEAVRQNNPENAVLNLKVCDPAAGSGHFLIAAAHRMARKLAFVRTGDEEPSPEATRKALRDVIGHCVYGVDINPMAVELCKVSLWMEALEPGKPLSFLEHRIQCGNSLLGTTPVLLDKGIPDNAFKPIEGDDKEICKEYKKRNKEQKKQTEMFAPDMQPWERLGDLAAGMMRLEDIPDDTIEGVRRKQERYEQHIQSTSYEFGHLWADAWCAAFVWKKTKKFPYPITEQVFHQIERSAYHVEKWIREEIRRLAEEYQFFHWHLAFPDVFRVTDKAEEPEDGQTGWIGGFDVVLGNPPWERLQFEEQDFFSERDPRIYAEPSQAKRRRMIKELQETNISLYQDWSEARRQVEAEANFLRASGRFPLSAKDKFNLYAVFSELVLNLYNARGRVGVIVKGGYITDKLCSNLFAETFRSGNLVAVSEFENKQKLFLSVHPQERFALVTLGRRIRQADFSFDNLSVEQLRDPSRHNKMSYDDIVLLSPNTRNCPKFPNARELEITRKCYIQCPPLIQHDPPQNQWEISIDRYINVSDVSDEIVTAMELNGNIPVSFNSNNDLVPLYEGKLIHQYDHRYASYMVAGNDAQVLEVTNKSPETGINFLRYIPTGIAVRRNPKLAKVSGLLAVRNITNRTNERGVIASVIPPNITDYSIRVIRSDGDTADILILLSGLNSFPFDYLARQRLGGTNLSNYILEQTPVIPPDRYTPVLRNLIVPRAMELTYTTWNLESFAKEYCYDNPPFRWDEERRFFIRCELDAAYFHLYGIERSDVDYIMETFPIVKRRDEEKCREYRTKRVILEIYDAMAEAMKTGRPYETILSPPPADPSVTHPRNSIDAQC